MNDFFMKLCVKKNIYIYTQRVNKNSLKKVVAESLLVTVIIYYELEKNTKKTTLS